MLKSKMKCPQCSEAIVWQDNPSRPFCSERCQLIDLGQWADESYRIPGLSQETISEENVILINNGKQDIERL